MPVNYHSAQHQKETWFFIQFLIMLKLSSITSRVSLSLCLKPSTRMPRNTQLSMWKWKDQSHSGILKRCKSHNPSNAPTRAPTQPMLTNAGYLYGYAFTDKSRNRRVLWKKMAVALRISYQPPGTQRLNGLTINIGGVQRNPCYSVIIEFISFSFGMKILTNADHKKWS